MNSRKQISLDQKIKIIEDLNISKLITQRDALQHLEDLKHYLSCLPGYREKYFNSFDAIRGIFIKKYEFSKKQSKITDYLEIIAGTIDYLTLKIMVLM